MNSPIIIAAAGWRSGSTLLQRLLLREALVWGEPYGHAGLLEGLFRPNACFTERWPEPHFFYQGERPEELREKFVGNLFPSRESLAVAQRAWCEKLFAVPAREAGYERWGIKEVRLDARHAAWLKELFPDARLLFLHRNPYDAYRSYAARKAAGWQWYVQWPHEPLTVQSFGRHWRRLVSGFLEQSAALGGLVLRYEDLVARESWPQIEAYLGCALDAEALAHNPSDGGPPPLAEIPQLELEELARQVEPLAGELGYTAKEGGQTSKVSGEKSEVPREKCVVLVPVGSHVEPACEAGLAELERRGYKVWRVRGYAAIDQGRNQMATDALNQGFEETLWIDSDIGFRPDDVERLRGHGLPLVCAIYPKKGKRELAVHVLPGTSELLFGQAGGLVEIKYAATGFLLVRREVYEAMCSKLALPLCNTQFKHPMRPFFQPLIQDDPAGPWYLAEDYAFCERARRCGYKVMADTTIRLEHIGSYAYSWEEAGHDVRRFATFRYGLGDERKGSERHGGRSLQEFAKPEQESAKPGDGTRSVPATLVWQEPNLARLQNDFPWPEVRPSATPRPSEGWLSESVQKLFRQHLSAKTKLVVELGAWLGLSTRAIANHAPGAAVITIDHWRGSPEHLSNPELAPLLPELFETFLTNCWDYREQILPIRMTTLEGLDLIARHALAPDVVYVDADHGYQAARADFEKVLDLFPAAVVLGDDWGWDSVRQAISDVARQRKIRVETDGTAWRRVP